jgi:hypothetical protein
MVSSRAPGAAGRRAVSGSRGGRILLRRAWALLASAVVALPALGAAWLAIGPPAAAWIAVAIAVVVLGVVFGARSSVGGFVLCLALSCAGVLVLSSLWAALGPGTPPPEESRAAAVYDLDARIVTRPLPRCEPRLEASEVLAERGAHPRLDGAGEFLWFDAAAGDGRRQVHRLERASGHVVCWTCDEPGNNVRPAPGGARSLVFDSDRFTSWREPVNTELYLAKGSGEAPARPARRLTFHPGPDDHALFHRSGVVVWSRGHDGRHAVVSASLRSGHGGVLLGAPGILWSGGARWTIPLEWSPDARTLAVADGQPLAPLRAVLLDPATGATRVPGEPVPPGSSASFDADGGWTFLATTQPRGAGALLPGAFGFLLAHLADPADAEPRFSGSRVLSGEPAGALTPVELGELAGWGEATGVAADPDGKGFVLGQRRRGSQGIEERLVAVRLACER